MDQVTIFDFVADPLFEELSRIPLNGTKTIRINNLQVIIEKKQIGSRTLFEYEFDQQHGLAKSIDDLIVKLESIENN